MLASMWKLLVQKKYFCSWMNVFNVICQDTVRKTLEKIIHVRAPEHDILVFTNYLDVSEAVSFIQIGR